MTAIDGKICRIDQDLLRYKEQMARLPDGPAKDSLKRQAMQLLQQKKQYEGQRGTMMAQSFNLEQANFAVESVRSTAEAVRVMQGAAKDLKGQMRRIDVTKVEGLREEMEDLMMESSEMNEVLSRAYSTPDYLDEADLDAELAMLQGDLGGAEGAGEPSYLADLPAAADGAPALGSGGSKDRLRDTSSLPLAH